MQLSTWQKRVKLERRIQLFTFLGLIGLLTTMVFTLDNMLLSSVLAFMISYLFSPLVNFLERLGWNRSVSIFLLFIISTLSITVGISALYPVLSSQFIAFKSEIPRYIEGTGRLIQETEQKLSLYADFIGEFDISQQVEVFLRSGTKSIFEDVPAFLSKSLTTMLLAPFFAFFMLKDGPTLSKKLFSLVPNNYFELFLNLHYKINSQMGEFIRARILESAIVGAVIWAGLEIIQFPFAPLLAIFAALTNLIPYLGPIIGVIPAFIIAFINGHGMVGILITSIPYLIAQLIDIFVIIPLVVAKIVDLHPVTVIVSFIIGAQLMGVMGMIIAIPVASTLKVTLTNVYMHFIQFRNP